MDFTDAAHPFEIAYFDRGPIDPKMLVLGGDWSAYWYNGDIYGSEIARGLDIFELDADEISDAERNRRGENGACSRAECAEPAEDRVAGEIGCGEGIRGPVGALASFAREQISDLRKAMQSAETSHMNKGKVAKLKKMAPSLKQMPPRRRLQRTRSGYKLWQRS